MFKLFQLFNRTQFFHKFGFFSIIFFSKYLMYRYLILNYLCFRCLRCPDDCEFCDPLTGICPARQDVYLKTAILCIQLFCMAVTVLLALIVFKQRKTKVNICVEIYSFLWCLSQTKVVGKVGRKIGKWLAGYRNYEQDTGIELRARRACPD